VVTSADDRKAALEVLRNAQFVYGLSRYPKKQVLAAPEDVKALRERLEAMRQALSALSGAERKKLDIPWADFEAIDSGTEAVWKAAKRATPKTIAQLAPLVRDEPEAGFLIAPVVKGGRKSAGETPTPTEKEEPRRRADESIAKKVPGGLTGKELAGLQLVIQERVTADEEYLAWLRGNHSLPLAEWRRRRAAAERARRAEERYIEKLFRSRSKDTSPD
jgi:hypothetical protein